MHSFYNVLLTWTPVGLVGVQGRALPQAPTPIVTQAPTVLDFKEGIGRRQQDPDAISLAQVLLTAVPQSIRQIAATNIPAASSILNEQFLDDNRPKWFLNLPWDIQVYLVEQFGPATAIPPTLPSGLESLLPSLFPPPSQPTETYSPGQTEATVTSLPTATDSSATSGPTSEASEIAQSSAETQTPPPSSQPSETASSATEPPASTGSPDPTEVSTASSSPTSTKPPAPAADPGESDSSLSKSQKLGIGIGVPLGILVAAALFGCCILYRRRQRKKLNGSLPPSSPGFIPRFAFHEKDVQDGVQHPQEPHQRLLNPAASHSYADLHNTDWDDEVIDTSSSGESVPTLQHPHGGPNGGHGQFAGPVMAPALFHTHTSNRARGKRTSYTSLHSVAEVSEPDDDDHTYIAESPVLPRSSPHSRRFSPPKNAVLVPPPIPESSTIKRKPVGSGSRSPSPGNLAAANMASQSLVHPAFRRNTPPRLSTMQSDSPYNSSSPYVSPVEEHNPLVGHTFGLESGHMSSSSSSSLPTMKHKGKEPTVTYIEDYGPEFTHPFAPTNISLPPPNLPYANVPLDSPSSKDRDGYIDIQDGLYGGNTSLSRYPESPASPTGKTPSRRGSRTDWPLRNFSIRGGRGAHGQGHQRRKSSPMWDRVYESP